MHLLGGGHPVLRQHAQRHPIPLPVSTRIITDPLASHPVQCRLARRAAYRSRRQPAPTEPPTTKARPRHEATARPWTSEAPAQVPPAHRRTHLADHRSQGPLPLRKLSSDGAVRQDPPAVGEPEHHLRDMRTHSARRTPPQFQQPASQTVDAWIAIEQHQMQLHRPRPVVHEPSGGRRPPPSRRRALALAERTLLEGHFGSRRRPWRTLGRPARRRLRPPPRADEAEAGRRAS